jgi:hypothetical protein
MWRVEGEIIGIKPTCLVREKLEEKLKGLFRSLLGE